MTTGKAETTGGPDRSLTDRRLLILVAEDVPVIHDVIELSLRPFKADYLFITDGQEVLDALEDTIPDLVLLDIALPGVDGWEVLRQMRANPRLSDVPVVVITAHGPGIEQDLMALGANAYLDKPFLPSALRLIVKHLL
ncbi:MAG: response regulator [Acidimicrobiia bacterium]|nr:response regulator [Acidimicrobiia bacterium]MDH5421534.1 response regulator [Acidimicrobiia bacterium]MDH5504793.1 response regulator [Acidimicrobiia bacterium]